MTKNNRKQKWYDTWWGALWTLAMIDATPGRSLREFMEVDEALSDLQVEEDEKSERASTCAGRAGVSTPCFETDS